MSYRPSRRFRPASCIAVLVGIVVLAISPPSGMAEGSEAPFPVHALLRGEISPPKDGEPLRVVHMTDTHIVEDGTILHGVDTAANLRVAIAAVNALDPRPHLVAVTGDLTLDSAEGLWVFKRLMERLEVPYFVVPGNHDKMLAGNPCKGLFAALGFPLYYSFDYAERHFVSVDAEEEQGNKVRGNLSEGQLEWLRRDLEEHSTMETLLFVHQHPLCDDWNSPNRFAENVPLLRAIRENPQVRWVFNGHSHDNRFLELEGTRFITTAATAYLFGKPSLPFEQHGSGFRIAEFADGDMRSRFVALSGEVFEDPPTSSYLRASKDPAAWVNAFGPDTASYRAPPQGRHVMVGLCQVPCRDGAIEENLSTVESAARAAAASGARVICFPESMDVGWVNTAAHELAQPIPGAVSERVAAIAKELGVYLCIGLTEKVEDGIHDSAILVGPGGELLLKHRKINTLVALLTPPYLQGRKEDIRVVDTPIGRIGVLICADTFVDEHLDLLRDGHPDLVLVPYGWAAPRDKWPGHGESLKATVSHAARRVGSPVVGPSSIGEITTGPWKGHTYEGESAAADSKGDVLFFGLSGRPQIAVFPVPLAEE